MKNSSFAVVGGQFRGAKLTSPDDSLTHPMGAREKNALFNRLSGSLDGAKVLDAYAGSGALALEALSRGAREVILVEKSAKIAQVARRNLERIAANSQWRVVVDAVGKFVEETEEKFDIIIADPPYNKVDLAEIEGLRNILAENGLLVLSHPANMDIPTLRGLEVVSSKKYAGAGITIYQARI